MLSLSKLLRSSGHSEVFSRATASDGLIMKSPAACSAPTSSSWLLDFAFFPDLLLFFFLFFLAVTTDPSQHGGR